MSPFEMIAGRHMVLPLHLLYQFSENNLASAITTKQYIQDLKTHLQSTFLFAQQKLEKSAKGRKTYNDRTASEREHAIGQKVFYFNYARQTKKENKFVPSWVGPYVITDKVSPVAYQIKIPNKVQFPGTPDSGNGGNWPRKLGTFRVYQVD